jgi:riboflavin synthase alpha subunit
MFTGIVEEIGEIVEAGAGVLRVRAHSCLPMRVSVTPSRSTAWI